MIVNPDVTPPLAAGGEAVTDDTTTDTTTATTPPTQEEEPAWLDLERASKGVLHALLSNRSLAYVSASEPVLVQSITTAPYIIIWFFENANESPLIST